MALGAKAGPPVVMHWHLALMRVRHQIIQLRLVKIASLQLLMLSLWGNQVIPPGLVLL